MRSHLVIPDPHAHYQHSQQRADWLARLIIDRKPDVVICLGDLADMPSLSGYDRGKKTFQGRTYRQDINAALEFNDRLWSPVRATKKRLPLRVILEGNHEHRIVSAINSSPELEGAIGLEDLEYERYYDEVVPYDGQTPGIVDIDGVFYAHYFVSGVMGRAISGEHPAFSLLSKGGVSCTAGHLHLADHCIRTSANGTKRMGLLAGVYTDYHSDWAGVTQNLWWKGVVYCHGVENGTYDPEFISLARIQREYDK